MLFASVPFSTDRNEPGSRRADPAVRSRRGDVAPANRWSVVPEDAPPAWTTPPSTGDHLATSRSLLACGLGDNVLNVVRLLQPKRFRHGNNAVGSLKFGHGCAQLQVLLFSDGNFFAL